MSAFAVHLWAKDDRLVCDIISAKNTPETGILMHMGADRECAREVSGYVGKLLKRLDLDSDCDTSGLGSL